VFAELAQGGVAGDAGAVGEHVQTTVARHDIGHRLLAGLEVGDVQRDRLKRGQSRAGAQLGQTRLGQMDVGRDHVVAAGRQRFADRRADAAGTAGDQGDALEY